MKKLLLVACVALIALGGCRTMSSLTDKITGTDDSLLTQVPEEDFLRVDEARFQHTVAEEKVTLAQLKADLSELREKLAGLELDLAKNIEEQRAIQVDLTKAEAIRAANLSERYEGAKEINGYKQDLLANEFDRIDIKADIEQAELHIADMEDQIKDQEGRIDDMISQHIPLDPAPPAPADGSESVPDVTSIEPAKPKGEVTLPDYLKVEDDPDVAPAPPGAPPAPSAPADTPPKEGTLPE